MTTSGSTVFALTRDQIITAAVRKTGRLASSQTLTAQQITDGAQALNTLIAHFQTLGMPLWARAETTFPLTLDTPTYTIGTGLTINVPAPLKLYQAFAINDDFGTEMEVVSNFDNSNSVLTTSGSLPTQISYQPQIDAGTITIWPAPDSTAVSDVTVRIIYQRPFEMFTAAGETMDIPKEWHLPVIYELAVLLAPEWGVPLNDRQLLKKEADEWLGRVLEFGQEDGSIFFQARMM
jgi:hypothetical protein